MQHVASNEFTWQPWSLANKLSQQRTASVFVFSSFPSTRMKLHVPVEKIVSLRWWPSNFRNIFASLKSPDYYLAKTARSWARFIEIIPQHGGQTDRQKDSQYGIPNTALSRAEARYNFMETVEYIRPIMCVQRKVNDACQYVRPIRIGCRLEYV